MIMVEQQYIAQGLAHADDLSGAANLSEVSTPSVYPDLTPYGTVSTSPFTYPAQCDPNLLTPISSAASPPLHKASKLVGQYPPPPSTPGSQQPSPPGSCKMYPQQWSQQFGIEGQSSQNSSPMASQAQVAQEYIENPYIDDGRRTPGPPEPYMGAFGVSHAPEPHPMSHHPYYLNISPPMDHQQPLAMSVHPREIPGAPLLNEPHPGHLRHRQITPDLHGHPERLGSGSPRRRTSSVASGKVTKRRSTKSRGGQPRQTTLSDPIQEHKNCFGDEVPPTLKPNCPEEERCIFESRWQHRHQKGQDMWESIQNDFRNRFHKTPGKEMLQMKFKRGRSKYIEWMDRDKDILREAWVRVEKNRYQYILDTFLELGGSRNMRLNASDIEVKVVNDLKLEEGFYMETHPDCNIRRRRKSTTASTRRRGNPRGVDDELPLSDEMVSVSSHNTHEDDVINQVHGRAEFKMEDEGSEMMGMQIWPESNVKMEPGVMQQRGVSPIMRLSPPSAVAPAAFARHR